MEVGGGLVMQMNKLKSINAIVVTLLITSLNYHKSVVPAVLQPKRRKFCLLFMT